MGLLDSLFGRKKLPAASREQLFALTTASVTLETELGLKSSGAAALVFKPVSAEEFARAESDLEQLLDRVAADSGSRIERTGDEYGYQWLVVRDPDLEDLVGAIHLVGSELDAAGFGGQLLAAAFPFEGTHRVYLIYGYKRGAFWPFVPLPGRKGERDNAEELELKAKLERELPVEQDISRWFGLFDAPL